MIFQLREENYERVRELFKNYGDHVVINAIIDNNNLGRIYVDDIETPKTALIWAKNEMSYLVGDYKNNDFIDSLEDITYEKIFKEALEVGETYFQVQAIDEEWNSIIEDKFKHKLLKKYSRWRFEFNDKKYAQLGEYKECISGGYNIRRIDNEVLNLDEKNIIMDEIRTFWPSFEEFYKKGVGFCILHKNKVISTCISAYVNGNAYEISINTYRRKYRKKGLATLLSRTFVDYCVNNNIVPHWGTETFRHDSIKIAEKCGFDKLDTYSFYCFGYEELDNLILSVDYYLTKNINMSLAELYFEKVLEKGNITAGYFYWLSSSWAYADNKENAIFCLKKAFDAGFNDIEDLMHNDFLKSLYGTKEFEEIIEKYNL